MFLPDIGKEFKKQMENWFAEYPEIEYHWNKNELKINHPKKVGDFLTFRFNSKFVKIQVDNRETVFKRKIFKNIGEQVFRIRGYWINNLLDGEDTGIKKPKLNEHQIAIMFCNQKYGQVLTTQKNVFNGWGNVYQIFDNEEEAFSFIEIESKDDEIEIHAYNSNYEYIELKKSN